MILWSLRNNYLFPLFEANKPKLKKKPSNLKSQDSVITVDSACDDTATTTEADNEADTDANFNEVIVLTALYDFTGREPGDLTFSCGDKFHLISK